MLHRRVFRLKSPGLFGRRRGVACLGAPILLVSAVSSAQSTGTLAKRLSVLRGEVETLSSQLSNLTVENRENIRSLARQKSNVILDLQREKNRLEKYKATVREEKRSLEESQSQDAEMAPLFQRHLESIRLHVRSSLPFRRAERLAELSKLDEQVKSGLLSAPRAVARLWSFVEDEFRLTRESGLYQQTLHLDGQEHLADVVRLGGVALLFRTQQGGVGFAKYSGGAYSFVEVQSAAERKKIESIFDSFRKQVRVGEFELPNILAIEEVK